MDNMVSGTEDSSDETEENEDTEMEEEEHEEVFEGQTNDKGEMHGRGTIYFDKLRETKFQGHFINGVKEGRGSFFFADGSSLKGIFEDNALEGEGLYTYEDGSYMISNYKNGELNGYSKEYDCDHHVVFEGNYCDNIRTGVCHFYKEYGGHLFGCVNKEGKLRGKDVIYSYQDNKSFLKGTFKDDDMVSAQLAIHNGTGDIMNPYSYKKVKNSFIYIRNVSTSTCISQHPMQHDPYEIERVYVKPSRIVGAGEGLFSLISAGPHEVMSFYNGIRIRHTEVDGRDWKYNDNTISLDSETVIDVPMVNSSLNNYCASMGHKANHSFQPNCKYDKYNHPRFGAIKCIRTISQVEPGDELTVSYGYDHTKLETDAPDWYKKQLKDWEQK